VDHVGDGLASPDFRICAWRTNDCRNDLSAEELLAFCHGVICYADAVAVSEVAATQPTEESIN
jgi:hypothetical protein